MKKTNYFQYFAMIMLVVASLCFTLTSCENKEEEPQNGQSLDVYPWKDYPQSYIRMFDSRMDFRMLSVQRNGTALQIEYTLTNTGFGQDVSLVFVLKQDAGHDNLGNTYKVGSSAISSDVVSYINGGSYFVSGMGRRVDFLPNQTIKGSFTIKDFDINATAFSISVMISCDKPRELTLASNRMDFVNIPVPEWTVDDAGIPMM